MENKSYITITFQSPLELQEQLKTLAKGDARSLSNYIRLVLEKHVAEALSDEQADGQAERQVA